MEKINFTNGQAPALNGANLNQLQTNVEEAINEVNVKATKNIITCRLTSNYTIEKTNTYEMLPLSEWCKIGDKLSVNSDGGIVVGAGVNYIKIGATVRYREGVVGQKYMTIAKEGNLQLIQASSYRPSTTGVTIISSSDGLFPVKEGDIIGLYVYSTAEDSVGGSTNDNGQLISYLTAEVVE